MNGKGMALLSPGSCLSIKSLSLDRGYAMFRAGKILWQSTNVVCDLMAEYVTVEGSLNPQQINQANFTLVPDWSAAYFGANPGQPAPQTSAQPSPVPGQSGAPAPSPSAPPAGGPVPVPVTLPNTGSDDLIWLQRTSKDLGGCCRCGVVHRWLTILGIR